MASVIREWYRRAEVATLKAASFTSAWSNGGAGSPRTVDVLLGQNIPDALEKRTYLQSLTVVGSGMDTAVARSALTDVSGSAEHIRFVSPSKRVVFSATNPSETKASGDASSSSSVRLNVTGRDGCLATVDCKQLHGKVLPAGSTFGGLSFSDDESTVFYVAVTSPPKEKVWWGPKADDGDGNEDTSDSAQQ